MGGSFCEGGGNFCAPATAPAVKNAALARKYKTRRRKLTFKIDSNHDDRRSTAAAQSQRPTLRLRAFWYLQELG
jgi:hypothetical protein